MCSAPGSFRKYDPSDVGLAILVAVDATVIEVFPFDHPLPNKSEAVSLLPGDVLVMRGDVGHIGDENTSGEDTLIIHGYIDSPVDGCMRQLYNKGELDVCCTLLLQGVHPLVVLCGRREGGKHIRVQRLPSVPLISISTTTITATAATAATAPPSRCHVGHRRLRPRSSPLPPSRHRRCRCSCLLLWI